MNDFFLTTLSKTVMFCIWESKLNKQLPSSMKVLNDIYFIMEPIRGVSSKLREDMLIDLQICRNWKAEASRRG
jgi:hypothetical protein